MYKDHRIEELVELKIKLDELPYIKPDIEMGQDNQAYYAFHFAIELTYQSGSTKYELLHKGGYQISSYPKLEISAGR